MKLILQIKEKVNIDASDSNKTTIDKKQENGSFFSDCTQLSISYLNLHRKRLNHSDN